MSNRTTYEEIEALIANLNPPDQLRLAERIFEQVSGSAGTLKEEDCAREERAAWVDTWLGECDAVAESIIGYFDSADELRRIRDEHRCV